MRSLFDRRKFARFDILLNIEFKPFKKEIPYYSSGLTNNFSLKGFCFESQDIDLESKEPLELRVKLPQDDTFVSVFGDIVWKRQLKGKCLAGIKLRETHEEAKAKILDCCSAMWLDKIRSDNTRIKVDFL